MPFGKPISFFNQVQWQIPYYDSVVLFLNMTGNNQSNTITDKSKYGVTFSFYGNAVISSSQSASLPTSLRTQNQVDDGIYGTGTKDFIWTQDSINYTFLTASFTIESWLYVVPEGDSPPLRGGGFLGQANSQSDFWSLVYNFNFGNIHTLTIGAIENGNWQIELIGQLNDSVDAGIQKWIHAAIVRESFATGSTWRMFINGNSVSSLVLATGSYDGNFPDVNSGELTSNLTVGTTFRNLSRSFPGFIDDLIITKGVAKYKEKFFPIRYND
jgi:hypothetical protein